MSSPIVAFISIFLSLTFGVQPVEVLVADEVDHVELWLDYELVGRMQAPDWTLPTDFGSIVEPHLLEAVAFDEAGQELGRTEQWVNLPTAAADAEIVVTRDVDGKSYARLTWNSLLGDQPERIALSLDGRPLTVDDPSRVPLPPHDPAQLHFIRAELEFPNSVSVVEELTFGGSYGDRIDTDLTALPILLPAKGPHSKLPDLDELQTWFTSANGERLAVAAVDQGLAEVTIVRDRAAQPELAHLARNPHIRNRYTNRFDAALRDGQKMAFFWPFMVRAPSGRWTFPASLGWMSPEDGGIPWFLAVSTPPRPPDGKQLLADAVAVAGMNSLARNRRRAVVLILGRDPQDDSQLSPAVVRHFLSALRVPLHVWSPNLRGASHWGDIRDISSLSRFRYAVSDLARELDRQRIVWLQGRHLPQRIRLTDRAAGVELPG